MSKKGTTETTPGTKEDWFKLGVSYFQKHDFDNAKKYFEEALKIEPKYLSAICGKGNTLATTERFDEAMSCFEKALQLDEKCVDAINGKANIHFSKGELDQAIHSFDQIIDINSEYELAWYGKASILAQKNEPRQALSCFDKVLALDENHVPSLNGKGGILIQQNKNEDALNCYQKILEIDPGNSLAWFNRGSLLYDYQQFAESKASMIRSYLHLNHVEFQTFVLPFFKNFVERFHSPALLYRVLWHDFPQLISQENINPIAQHIFDSYADLADIIEFSKSTESGLVENKWRELSALISLFHGDPLICAELINEMAEKNIADLHLQYLLLLSLDGFLESREEYEHRVYEHLDGLDSEGINSNQCYYAGQLYFRKGDLDNALIYFDAAIGNNEGNSLASYFMKYYCAHLKKDERELESLFTKILNFEKKRYQAGKYGFLNTEKSIKIDLRKSGWEKSFYRYSEILEVSGALILFQDKLKDKETMDRLQVEDPNFDYGLFTDEKLRQGLDKWWELTESSKQALSMLGEKKNKMKINSLENERKRSFDFERFTDNPDGFLNSICTLMEDEMSKEPKSLKDLHFAIQIAYLKGQIALQESLLLMYYALFFFYSTTMEKDGVTNKTFLFKDGLKTGFRNFLGSLSELMIVRNLPAHRTFYQFSLISGISQSFFEAFFTSENPTIPDSFDALQLQYSTFIQDQKESLGLDFYHRYPIYDFGLLEENSTKPLEEKDPEKVLDLVGGLGKIPQITKIYEECAELIYELMEKTSKKTKIQAVNKLKRINPVFASEIQEDYL